MKSYRLDITLPDPVGRINRRSLATNSREFGAEKQVIYDLWKLGQIDVLLDYKAGRLDMAHLLHSKRTKMLDSDHLRTTLRTQEPFADAFRATLPRLGKSPETRVYYADCVALLVAHAERIATVADLERVDWPALWLALADKSASRRNGVKAAVSAFLTAFLGDKHHPFRRDVVKRMGPKERIEAEPRAVTVAEFQTLLQHIPAPLRPAFVTLAATGMRVGEFLWLTESDLARFPELRVKGKTGAGWVSVDPALEPIVRAAVPCLIAPRPSKRVAARYDARYKRLQKAARAASKATGIPFTAHTLRHFYAALGTDELPEVMVQQALRHKTASMTRNYSKRKNVSAVAEAVGRHLRKIG